MGAFGNAPILALLVAVQDVAAHGVAQKRGVLVPDAQGALQAGNAGVATKEYKLACAQVQRVVAAGGGCFGGHAAIMKRCATSCVVC